MTLQPGYQRERYTYLKPQRSSSRATMLLENKMDKEKQGCAGLLNYNFFKTVFTKETSSIKT